MNTVLPSLHSMSTPVAMMLLALVAFAETGVLIGFLIPGDSLMLGAGMLIATHVLTAPLGAVVPVVALAAIAGDQVAFQLGSRLGPRILSRPSSRWLNPRHLTHAHAFFERYGPRAVILARFVPLARTMTPVVAGAGRMPVRRFAAYNMVGAAAWSSIVIGAGYAFGAQPLVARHLGLLPLALVAMSLTPVAVGLAPARCRRPTTAHPTLQG